MEIREDEKRIKRIWKMGQFINMYTFREQRPVN